VSDTCAQPMSDGESLAPACHDRHCVVGEMRAYISCPLPSIRLAAASDKTAALRGRQTPLMVCDRAAVYPRMSR
jgi:hypothetical protein